MEDQGIEMGEVRKRLKLLRQARGLTQEALAERAGMDAKYYQSLELGHTANPTVDTLNRLAKALGVPVWEVLFSQEQIFEWLRIEILQHRRKSE